MRGRIFSRTWLVGITIAVLVAVTAVTAAATSGRGAAQSRDTARPKNLAPFNTWTSALDGGTTVSISTHGNIIRYESPTGYEHIGVGTFSEGYILCYTNPASGATVNTFDTGSSESGWGPSVTSGAPVAVDRDTADGLIHLKQVYSFDGLRKSLGIEMRITNNTAVNITNVILRRQVDFDVDTGGAKGWSGFLNWHARSTRGGVWAWDDPSEPPAGFAAHGMLMQHNSANPSPVGTRAAKVTEDILDSTCSPASKTTPLNSLNDDGETIQYNLGTLPAHQTKNFRLSYYRM
jgi:hypothetical protein